jgi:hypothetical protein
MTNINIMKYLLIVSVLCIAFSCKKQEVQTYLGSKGVTFYIGAGESDSTNYSFAFALTPKQRDTVFLKMRIVGSASDKSRNLMLKAAPGTTARSGIDYELPLYTVPAGAITILYPVIVINSSEMLTRSYRLVLQVDSKSDFMQGAVGLTNDGSTTTTSLNEMKIQISNQMLKPSYWSEVEYAFGEYSIRKIKFMIEVTGLTDFSYEAIGLNGYYNLPAKLRNALEEFEKLNGPMIDESGKKVEF